VSSTKLRVRNHKQRTDRCISQAYARLHEDAHAMKAFGALLACVRVRAPRLLDARIDGGPHPGVETLVHLARFARVYVRPLTTWPGCDASWRGIAAALAQHLLATHAVPRFLAAAWYATDALGERKRHWYVAHGGGARFRSLRLPLVMTSRMEHFFLSSPDHFEIERAMRRAELLALGAHDDMVRAILATRLGTDLSHAGFWRTVWRFLIQHAGTVGLAQVAPIIDFIQFVRHERVGVETANGAVMRDAPEPSFSMKGRTVDSLLRLMHQWHRGLRLGQGGWSWSPSTFRPMVVEEEARNALDRPTRWRFLELTSSGELRAEGATLHHCVASYAHKCWRGDSRIWSLRVEREGVVRSVLTIEIDVRTRSVIQVRGRANRYPTGTPLRLLHQWAARERLPVRT